MSQLRNHLINVRQNFSCNVIIKLNSAVLLIFIPLREYIYLKYAVRQRIRIKHDKIGWL